MDNQGTKLTIDYTDINAIILALKDGLSPRDAAQVLFHISPVFENGITDVILREPLADVHQKDAEIAIKCIKEYLNI